MKIRLVTVVSGSGESTELLEGHIRKISPSAQILRVTDGSTASAIISEHSPDLILVDTMSPGLDAFVVCLKLKHDDRTGSIPQICFYSPDDRESRLKALKSGADGVLPWPPEDEELSVMAASLTKKMERHKKQLAHLENTFSESEEKYRNMFMDNPQPMWIYDMDTLAFLEVNEAAVRHYGYSREEFMSMNLKDIRPADEIETFLKNIKLTRKENYQSGEWRHLKKNGELIYVEITSHNAVFKGSKARHVMVNDITERKIQEQILREKDMQLRKLSANLHDFIFQFTRKPDGTYIVPFASEGIRNIFGCSPEDVLNDFGPIARVIHPDDIEKVIDDIENSARNLSYFTCEFRVQRPGQPLQWIFSRSTPEKLPDGSITWYGFNADITYRKQVEEALRESESKFRKIYEEGPYGMALVNRELKFVMANRTICRITGYDESELQNMTFYDITHPDDRAAGLEIHNKLVTRETDVIRSEKRYLRKDGSVIWASITVASNYDDTGAFTFNLAIIEDITERRLASEQASILNKRLSFLVEAIQELSSSASMKDIMKTVINSARGLLNADGATFVLRDGDLCYYADEDAISPLWKGQRFPMDKCISGWVMQNRQAVIIEDVFAVSIIPHEIYRSTFVRSLAMAPIRLNNPLGVIGVYWSTNVTSSAAELQLLQTLADAAAKAVENVQLIEGLERTISDRTADLQAVNRAEAEVIKMKESLELLNRHLDEVRETERAAIAREIHDQLGQSLTALKIDVNYLHDKMADASEEQSKLELMSGMITEMIKDVQRIASELRPPILDDLGLVSAMEWYIREFEKRTGVKCRTNFDSVQFPMEKKNLTLYRILQEALTNVSRHSGAKKVEISLSQVSNLVSFEVADNGTGFDSNKIDSFTSLGFLGIRERLKQHEGHLEIETSPGKGTRLKITLPIN